MGTISIWEGTSDESKSYPALKGELEADVVIVGGGITGLTATMLLTEAGKKVVLLEARQLGLGTTGNSTGNLYVTVDEHLSTIKRKWNAGVMKAVVASRSAALDLIRDTIHKHHIDCDFYETSFNYFAEDLTDEASKFLESEYEALDEAGLSPKFNDDPALPFEIRKCLTVGGQAQFHPLKYCRALAALISKKCDIFENSQVIDFDKEKSTVYTEGGSVRAEKVIMATHTPKGVYLVHTVLGPYREHGVAAELRSGTFPRGIFWGVDQPKHSLRTFQSGGKEYIMVIGDKYKTGTAEDNTEYIARLEGYLGERFNIGNTAYIWGGQHYRSADGLPYIGNHGDNLFFTTGFATDGLVYGTLAAMIVSDRITGRKNAWADMYRLDRFTPVKSFKEFFKVNLGTVGEYLKDTPWNADAFDFRGIKPGEARIIEKDQEKLAVYKDEAGKKHIVSAVCTHMKCIVNWNPAEKSWDCPCHGSRFDIEGKVIEGPAVVNLEKK